MKIIHVARKPLAETSVALNCTKVGAGALNISASRVSTSDNLNGGAYAQDGSERWDGAENWRFKREGGAGEFVQPTGRWPSNLILQHLPECADECAPGCPVPDLDESSGERKTTWVSSDHANNRSGEFLGAMGHPGEQGYNDTGGASRFFKQVGGKTNDG